MTKQEITLKDIYDSIEDLRCEVRDTYVTKDEFNPVKAIAYGMVGFILVGVLGALITNVIKAFS